MSFIQVFVNGYIQMINEYLIQRIHSCRKTDTIYHGRGYFVGKNSQKLYEN